MSEKNEQRQMTTGHDPVSDLAKDLESLSISEELSEVVSLLLQSGRAGMQVAPDKAPSSGGGRPIRIVRPVDESEAIRKLGLDKSSKK